MTQLHVIAGPGADEVVSGLALLPVACDVRVVRAATAADLPTDVGGHVVLTSSVPEGVAARVAALPAGQVHGLVLLADTANLGALGTYLPSLAAWRTPTLVVAPAEGPLREVGQVLSARLPDAVFVVTKSGAAEPEATTVQWLASFLSIVDGLHTEVLAP